MSTFSAKFLDERKKALVNRLAELRSLMVVGDQDDGSVGGDLADKASAQSSAEYASITLSKQLQEVADIDAAMRKFDRGTYGICEITGKPIAVGRLEAFPTARYSVEAQSKIERRRR